MGGMGGMPPGMESMMSGMMGGMGGMGGMPPGMGQQASEPRKDRWSVWWMLIHALGALLLSVWTLKSNTAIFDGTEMSRTLSSNLTRDEKPVCHTLPPIEPY